MTGNFRNPQSDFLMFVETSPGHFDAEIGTSTTGVTTTSSTRQWAVAASLTGKKHVTNWSYGSQATVTNYGILKCTGTGGGTTRYPSTVGNSSGYTNLTVNVAHGTYRGSQSGSYQQGDAVAIVYTGDSNPTKYVFAGWKVTLSTSTSGNTTLLSEGYERTHVGTKYEYVFPAGYRGAIVLQMGSQSYPATVEAMYDEVVGTYDITYLEYDGTASSVPKQTGIEAGSKVYLSSTTPSKSPGSQYEFLGWNLSPVPKEGSPRGKGESFTMPAGNVTATAYWSQTKWTYSLYYSGLSGATPSSYPRQTIQTGDKFTLSGNPTKPGNDFLGWVIHDGSQTGPIVLDDPLFGGSTFQPMEHATKSYYAVAKWGEKTPHTLTYATGYHGGTPPAQRTGLYQGDKITLAAALTRVGYTFHKWRVDPGETLVNAGGTYEMPGADVTATAVWLAATVTLTYNHGYDSGSYGSVSGSTGTVISLMGAQSRSGYYFLGWLVVDQNDDEHSQRLYQAGASYALRSNATATAVWSPLVTYTVRYDKNGSDVTGDDIPAHVVTQGNQVMVRAPDLWNRAGYTFVCWNTSASGNGKDYFPDQWATPTDSLALYAVWAKPDSQQAQPSGNSTYDGESKTGTKNTTSAVSGYDLHISSTVSTGPIEVRGQTATGLVGGYYDSGVYYSQKVTSYYVKYDPASGKYYKDGVSSGPYYSERTGSSSSTENVSVSVTADNVASDLVFGASVTVPSSDLRKSSTAAGGSTDRETVTETSLSTSLGSASKVWTAPTVENYEFLGWYTMAEAISYGSSRTVRKRDFSVLLTKDQSTTLDVLLKAKFKCTESSTTSYAYTNYIRLKYRGKLVTVLLDAGDGSVEPFMLTVRYGDKYGYIPSPASPEGYLFDGWFTAASGGTQVTADSPVSNPDDHVLYAHYRGGGGTVQVTVMFDGMSGVPSYSSKAYTIGSAYGSLPTCGRTGYDFAGWFTEPYAGAQVGTGTIVERMNPQVLYAHWKAGNWTVTLNANTGTVSPTSVSVPKGSAINWLPEPTKSGSTFLGWFTAASGGTAVTVSTVPTANMTIYAHWSAGGGSATGETVVPRGWINL